ncbi:hypothetical protein H6G17_19185 [Chroococcidiopsis sp. FACHB-1243]|uniref:hypothetical protein n=1 Tax=Chroococcidiopsis sp. [FACHB-1243] TaxID=2692781 RepID=UPI001781108E|nr:hypothetical protein [Chroococcidiopsis sp. [FACHB-1243]]MBD2307599.1 hypothetical protein [Chroococcidiopsis sp. [FACHB-1243]]
MAEIFNLGMSDEEYLQLNAQGRNPVQEQILIRNLIRAGVPAAEANRVAPLLQKLVRSPQEEILIKKVWQQVRSQ